ncbi:alpha/beta fold hydrolase [Microbacterium luticocti]|uniref:alpha/beta fold hydrolase n=1 Tax=Microbacterium luticocti TaxID=451764 RepID=UPI00041F4045|nr:alpha/beta hydrolase [Microbacterium luticocti]
MADELGGGGGARPYRFAHAGASIVVEEQGAGDRVFVLVHGIGMGRSVFGDLVPLLAAHGRVIAIDQPGYGEAPEPARTLTMERTADLLAAFLRERVRRPVVLIGHSMGSQVVLETAVRHPALVERLVLAAPTVDATARSAIRQLLRMAADLAVESPLVLLRGAREYLRAGPHLRRKMHAMLVHRPEDAYPRVRVPTLVLRGANDRVCPADWCSRVARSIPNARLDQVPAHGHETMIRDPRPAAELILSFAL